MHNVRGSGPHVSWKQRLFCDFKVSLGPIKLMQPNVDLVGLLTRELVDEDSSIRGPYDMGYRSCDISGTDQVDRER